MNWDKALPYLKQECKAYRVLDKYGYRRYVRSEDNGETFRRLYVCDGEESWFPHELTQEDLDGDWTVVVETINELS